MANKFHLTIKQTVFLFNIFLIPRLELALHYVHGSNTNKWLKMCDRIIIGAIKHKAQTPLRLSHSALALILNLDFGWLSQTIS